jgi:hypothetical protein
MDREELFTKRFLRVNRLFRRKQIRDHYENTDTIK